MSDDLTPMAPAEAVELYLSNRDPEVSDSTIQNQRYRLKSFVEWCDEAGIQNLNELTGRDLQRFRKWKLDNGVNKVTLNGILQTLRVFLEFCASVEAVEQGIREKVILPDLERHEQARDEYLDADRAEEILNYLDRFEYASRQHVILGLLWHAGIRLGTLRAIDVGDFDAADRCLEVRHRPETETPLKNGAAAERAIALGQDWVQILEDYIHHNRHDVVDDHGRKPLITSRYGRLSDGAIRTAVYQWTRPCMIGDCPHDRNPDTCEAMQRSGASKCPSSRSPHGLRRGSITMHLREGTPQEVVSGRMNVSGDVLDQHYDERSEREKMELRREFLEGI